jgi:Domain of unknown function (DUF4340)
VTGRGVAAQGGLAALGLLAAYLTWQREPERAPGAVTIIDANKSDVTLIRYEDDSNAVDLTRPGQGKDVWLHLVVKKAAEPKPDPHGKADAKPPAPTPPPPPPRDLPGGEGAKKLYDQFAPLTSPRAFGVLEAGKLKELGLDAPKRKLEVTVKGDVRKYEIGQPTTAGGGESFLRDTRDGRVYLMPRSLIGELQNATHMIDRRLHTFELADFDRIKLSAGGKEKEFLQVGRESRSTAGFAPPKTPDKRDQMAKNWHDSLWRLFPSELLGRGEQPAGGKPSVVLRVDYFEGKDNVGWIEIAKIDNASGPSDDVTPIESYVRTEHTAGWAKIHSANQLIADAQKLIAAP